MKLEKNKIVFAAVLLCIVLFVGGYAFYLMGDDEAPAIQNNQIPIPELENEQKEYQSKLDAINDLKEVRQTNAPSIYDERLLDSTGVYDPDLLDKEKMRMVDSIYKNGRMDYTAGNYNNLEPKEPIPIVKPKTESALPEIDPKVSTKELGLEQQLFFASNPQKEASITNKDQEILIPVIVDGTQTVKANYRLRMRLMKDAEINGFLIPRNTLIYGFVGFQPNRAMINIDNINHHPTKLKAFDYQDGNEGIYVENSFRADATREVVDDVVQDINIAGLPQVGGVKKIFQRNNRNIKVTVLNNYRLILKVDSQVNNRQ
ncbi:conjugative transposon protein TraM [Mariniflexile sp.]|uniref:conjugative transposon protein TraM n=1 Tax=Mariniflexile sp. TaxID=1979402 RepID=UPI00404759B3